MKRALEHPVYWETFDGRPAGQHKAKVLEVLPYTGKFTEFFNAIFRLSAPTTRKGWIEMAVKV